MIQEELIEDLKNLHEEDKKQTRTVTLTVHEINYLMGRIEEDDDYATEYVMDNYEFENWKKDENNDEYQTSKKLEKICQEWLDNLHAKLNYEIIES
jgi:hypothetical protein